MTEQHTATAPAPSRALPAPGRPRWQPLRIGLVDMFYYEVEEFWFRDGRLLLRGNNGTGKSKVLALALPFLLDGELAAHRVEPDGDPKKRMEWNLLLGGEHPHPERLGYTWIEFGRRTDDGETEFRTLGCGLKAASGRGIARHWFFVTEQRIGAPGDGGLALIDNTRTALSRDRLAEAIEGRGMVYDQARAYRRAVDEELFGLGEQRYSALVDLLIQLRQPQLSKRPNETALSKALTEALPPMDQAIIADVAEAFRSMDEEKDELRSMVDAEQAASTFLEHYRRYARAAARRRARPPREANSAYESLQRKLGEAQDDRERAAAAITEAEEAFAALQERRTRLAAEEEALRAGPEMRSARELDQAAAEADRTREQADSAVGDRDHAAARLARYQDRLDRAAARLDAARERLAGTLTQAADAAERAGIGRGHAEDVDAPLRGLQPDTAGPQRAAEGLLDRRRHAIDHLKELAERDQRAAAGHAAAERRLAEAETDVAAQAERQERAGAEVTDAERVLLDAVRGHFASTAELRPADPVGMLDRLQEWSGHLSGENPARAEAAAAARAMEADLAGAEARLGVEQNALTEKRADLAAELDELQSGGQRGPRPPYTRTPGARDGRPGAPLWRLVDFTDTVPAERRAGLEAALEASGLLDAWVRPDGTVLDADTHDALLAPADRVHGSTLAGPLRPAVDRGDPQASAVSEDTVARLLSAVGHGADAAAHTWVADDGRYRIGALQGSWTKESAEYIGEGAREEARRARIAATARELADTDAALEALAARAETIAERRSVLDAELAAVPSDSGLRGAHARLVEAGRALGHARERREERFAQAADAAENARAAADEVRRAAEELGLPADPDGLEGVREAVSGYRVALAELWPAVREHQDADGTVRTEQSEVEGARAHHEELAVRAAEAAEEAAAADQRHDTLRSTVGAAVAELQRRLRDVAQEQQDCADRAKQAQADHSAAIEARGRAHGRIEQLESDVAEAVRSRGEAIAALQRFAATGLLTVALPDLDVPPMDGPWAADPAVRLARVIDRELAETDDSDAAWDRVQRRIAEELRNLQDVLSRHGHTAAARMLEDGVVVQVVFQSREHTVPDLADALGAEVAERQRMLSAREREILENHLITEVAGTLQELIGAAERQVQAMNTELGDRPTSTGMRLRLVWRLSRDAPPGLAAARDRLLRQAADAWSPDDRAAVGEFLQTQIDRVRAGDQSGTWLEHLTRALDYRSWHEFGVERHQHGQWRAATGPASGGERVLSVSIPLFAAASSHYATAGNPNVPRLITLDEAFAGVDDDSRAKCLGLLHAFDLDVVMTSEREWGCYPQVPGLAIAQLSRVDEVAAVLVTRWEWDGRERARGIDPHPFPEPDPVASAAGSDQDARWN